MGSGIMGMLGISSSAMIDAGAASSAVLPDGLLAGMGLSGALAGGGPVSSGASYLVGEKGPEIFTPTGSGTIIPNGSIGGSPGAMIHYNPVIQIDSRTDQAQIHQLVSKSVAQGNADLVDKLQRAGKIA
jgi:phage-related minor tail protein